MRLYQRVGPWFRTGTLEYSEVADMPTTVQQLAEAGFGSQLQLSDTSGLQSLAEVSFAWPGTSWSKGRNLPDHQLHSEASEQRCAARHALCCHAAA